MATTAKGVENFYQETLVNYLVSMARTVEGVISLAIDALLSEPGPLNAKRAGEVFLTEPRINEMEIIIDEQAVRLLRSSILPDADIRLIVATLRINNDLERMGDLAVNTAERVVTLAGMRNVKVPEDIHPLSVAVKDMVSKSLGALVYRNVDLANEVLRSDDKVDHYRDLVCDRLLAEMTQDPGNVAPDLQFVLASRHLERIADHATNIAEDVIYWVRGLEVRHGRALLIPENDSQSGFGPSPKSSEVDA